MNQKRLWMSATIIAIVIFISFVQSVPHTTRDVVEKIAVQEETAAVPVVSLRDIYKKGVHTISGSVEAPNACATVAATATSTPAGIVVLLSLTTNTGVCLQLPTTITFSTTISAPASVPLSAVVNGVSASTTPL